MKTKSGNETALTSSTTKTRSLWRDKLKKTTIHLLFVTNLNIKPMKYSFVTSTPILRWIAKIYWK